MPGCWVPCYAEGADLLVINSCIPVAEPLLELLGHGVLDDKGPAQHRFKTESYKRTQYISARSALHGAAETVSFCTPHVFRQQNHRNRA